jgi:hypothetical protein
MLVIEMETEDTLGVKFPKGVCPEERMFVRVEESWVHVERKPKLVVRCWGAGYMGPRRVKGLEEDVENAILFVKSAKVLYGDWNFHGDNLASREIDKKENFLSSINSSTMLQIVTRAPGELSEESLTGAEAYVVCYL